MDQRRQYKPEGASMLPGTSFAHQPPTARSRAQATANANAVPYPPIEVPSFSAFQAQTSRVNVPSPVRRKPLPASASPTLSRPRVPKPLSTGGQVVAVGLEELTFEPPKRSSAEEFTSVQRGPHALSNSVPSPELIVRDLDQ